MTYGPCFQGVTSAFIGYQEDIYASILLPADVSVISPYIFFNNTCKKILLIVKKFRSSSHSRFGHSDVAMHWGRRYPLFYF